MGADLITRLAERACTDPRRIAFADGPADDIVAAARRVADLGAAHPVLVATDVGSVADTSDRIGIPSQDLEVVAIDGPVLDELVADYERLSPGFPSSAARRLLADPLAFAAMLVRTGRADALVAGSHHSTGEVVAAAQLLLGLADGVETASSAMIMDIPGYTGPEGTLLAFADCAVVPSPSATQLADIAIATAATVEHLLGWEPRVALLSFSTHGSADDPSVDRIRDALEQIRRRAPSLAVDGEMQVDAALDATVAANKGVDDSPVAGRANTLIFPDLNAGNIGYKLVQRLTGGGAFGPLLQGFARPVSDLSRGASVDDIVAATIMTSLRARARP